MIHYSYATGLSVVVWFELLYVAFFGMKLLPKVMLTHQINRKEHISVKIFIKKNTDDIFQHNGFKQKGLSAMSVHVYSHFPVFNVE